MSINPTGNNTLNNAKPSNAPNKNDNCKSSTSVYFEGDNFVAFKEAVGTLELTDKKIIKEMRAWIHEIEWSVNAAHEISVPKATYYNSILKKEIFRIDKAHLTKVKLDKLMCEKLKQALITTDTTMGELALLLGLKNRSQIGDLTSGKRKTISIAHAKIINKHFSSRGCGKIFRFKSILESAENKNNDTNRAPKRSLDDDGVQETTHISKKAKTEPSDNTITTNATTTNATTTNATTTNAITTNATTTNATTTNAITTNAITTNATTTNATTTNATTTNATTTNAIATITSTYDDSLQPQNWNDWRVVEMAFEANVLPDSPDWL